MSGNMQRIYNGNDYDCQLDISSAPVKIPFGQEVLGQYYDGYPEIIKGSECSDNYQIIKEKDVRITVRDGIVLYADIYRPESSGKFPALLAYAYWMKNNNEAVEWMGDYPQKYLHSPLWDGSLEACDPTYTVPRGFVHVIVDPRGVGDSEGYGTKPWFNKEDIYDVIEWIAEQPWCTGKVGMIGPSAYSAMQIHAAAVKPPHLAAIRCDECACGTWDYFNGTLDIMAPYMIETGGHGNDAPPGLPNYDYTPLPPTKLNDPKLPELLEEAKAFPDYHYNTKWYSFLCYPRRMPVMFDMLLEALHPYKGCVSHSFTNEADADQIEIPAYLGTPWNQRLYGFFTFDIWNRIRTPKDQKKIIVYPPNNTVRPYIEYHDEMVRWNEYWLKGIDNGIMDEPSVKLFVMGINKWRFANEWPLSGTEYTKFYLHPEGKLKLTAPSEDAEPDVLFQQAIYKDPTVYCLTYSSGVLEQDVTVIGEASLKLTASLDIEDTTWYADLIDVQEDGKQLVVSSGALRAKFRAIDAAQSTQSHPIHPWAEPVAIVPGEINEYDIQLIQLACVFQKGHEIRLVLRNQDDLRSRLAMNGVYRMPFMQDCEHRIYFGKSHLLLPVINQGR